LTAPLHDVGKIGIADDILQKGGPLSIDERQRMKEHCRIGAEILTEDLGPVFKRLGEIEPEGHVNELLRMAARIALCHHEWWDGMGYPKGLQGEEIPIEARIVAVADVYDALRSKRPYKFDFGANETLQIIHFGSGSQFDPGVVGKFSEIFELVETALQELRDGEAIQEAA